MALVTLTEVKTHASITGTTNDTLLSQLIEDATTLVETMTGVFFSPKSQTDEFFSYEGDGVLTLSTAPVISLSSVLFNGVSQILTNFNVDKKHGILYLAKGQNARFDFSNNDIVVNYSAGVSIVPNDIKLAAKELVTEVFNNIGGSSFESKRLGDYSFKKFKEVAARGIPPLAELIIDRYKLIT